MADQKTALMRDNHSTCYSINNNQLNYEGHLRNLSANDDLQWVVADGNKLYFYKDRNNKHEYSYHSVRRSGTSCNKHRSKSFYLLPNTTLKNPAQKYEFEAPSTVVRDEWIEYLRSKLPDRVGTTVQWTDQYETCNVWLLVNCIMCSYGSHLFHCHYTRSR